MPLLRDWKWKVRRTKSTNIGCYISRIPTCLKVKASSFLDSRDLLHKTIVKKLRGFSNQTKATQSRKVSSKSSNCLDLTPWLNSLYCTNTPTLRKISANWLSTVTHIKATQTDKLRNQTVNLSKSGKKTTFGMCSRKKSRVSQLPPFRHSPGIRKVRWMPHLKGSKAIIWRRMYVALLTSIWSYQDAKTTRPKKLTISWLRTTARGSCSSTPNSTKPTSCTSKWTQSTNQLTSRISKMKTVKIKMQMRSWKLMKSVHRDVVPQDRLNNRDLSLIATFGRNFSRKISKMTQSHSGEIIPFSYRIWQLSKKLTMKKNISTILNNI